jgi:hypothetical protein
LRRGVGIVIAGRHVPRGVRNRVQLGTIRNLAPWICGARTRWRQCRGMTQRECTGCTKGDLYSEDIVVYSLELALEETRELLITGSHLAIEYGQTVRL